MRNSTIKKELGFVKWFLRWSEKKKYSANDDYKRFAPKLKTTPKKVIFLTDEELEKLELFHIPVSKQYLERVRDVFLFCCYTGLRHSDVYNLKRSNAKKVHIEIVTIKSTDATVIEFNNRSRDKINKYKNVVFDGDKAPDFDNASP